MPEEQNQSVIPLLNNLSRDVGNVSKDVGQIKTDLAVNTTKTGYIEEHLRTLNGKVIKQEERQQKLDEETQTVKTDLDSLKKGSEKADRILTDYRIDKARVWAAIGILLMLGGTVITLSIMAINSKIKSGITEALSQYDIEIK